MPAPALTVQPAPDGGTYLLADGVVQSHVHPDPTVLAIPYVRQIADHLDNLRAGPLRVLHLGAGALTLARYVAWTRPGSPQTAVDNHKSLQRFLRRNLPLDPLIVRSIEFWTDRADRVLTKLNHAHITWDAIVVDLFDADLQIPVYVPHTLLTPGGIVLTHSYRPSTGHTVDRWQPSEARAAAGERSDP